MKLSVVQSHMVHEVEILFKNQVEAWPRLAQGVRGLSQAQTRPLRIDWFDIFVRHIPHRLASTTAKVDPVSISNRPCFLCAGNLDPEEQGIPFGENYTIYFNPFPIVERHLSVIHREHRPQRIAGEFGSFLDLAKALPGYFVIYNGPECGASAPDHLHFQAGLRSLFPIEKDAARARGIALTDYGRNVFVFRDADRSRLVDIVDRAIALLTAVTNKEPEPMLNLAATFQGNEWMVYLFPRAKHRPSVYHSGEIRISPGAIDLCGIVVAAFQKDYDSLSSEDVAGIFREVTLPDNVFVEVASKL